MATDKRGPLPSGEVPHIVFAAANTARLQRRWAPAAAALAERGLRCTIAGPHLAQSPGEVRALALPGGADTRPGALAAALALSAAWQSDAPDVLVIDGHRLARATAEVARLFHVPVVIAVVAASGRQGSTLGRWLAHAAPLESRVDQVIPYGAAGPLPLGAGIDPAVANPDNPLLADRITAERQILAGRGKLLVSVLGAPGEARDLERDLLRREARVSLQHLDPASSPGELHLAIGASQVLVCLLDDGDAVDLTLMAASLRTPVVAPANGNLARIVEQANCGLVARPGAALLTAVRELLADPMLRRRLGSAGRLLAERDGAVASTTEGLLALADRIVRRKFGEPVHLTGGGELRAESEVQDVARVGRRDLIGGGRKGG